MRFHPSKRSTLALLLLAAAFAWLGVWQWQRMQGKQELMTRFEQASARSYAEAAARGETFSRITVTGEYSDAWHLLRDNRIERGRAGVEVLSLFRPLDGPPLLVNRGWLPMPPDRRSLPQFTTPAGRITVSGLLAPPPGPGVQLGEPAGLDDLRGPTLLTYLDLDRIRAALAPDLAPSILLLDPADPTGFGERAWSPAVMLPGQHRAYAVQWFALAAAALVIWLTLGLRRPRSRDDAPAAARGETDT